MMRRVKRRFKGLSDRLWWTKAIVLTVMVSHCVHDQICVCVHVSGRQRVK